MAAHAAANRSKGPCRRIGALIADLDADDFDRREAASKELAAAGPQAESALRKALEQTDSAEVTPASGRC